MILSNGLIYTVDKNIHITSFKNMIIRSNPTGQIRDTNSIINYWMSAKTDKKRAKDLSIYTLVSLFPLASVLFAISLGIVTYRYEKGFVYVGVFGVLFSYFASIMLLAKKPFIAIPVVFSLFFITSLFAFYQKISKKY